MNRPIIFTWDGEAMVPLPRYAREMDSHFVVGEKYMLTEHQERSRAAHNFYFASLADAFANLPEDMADRYQSVEQLRKVALIRSGYCDERSIVCGSKAEAQRVAAFIRPLDEYAIVTVSGPVVQVFTAQSQSVRAMGKERFKESVDRVLSYCASLIGVSPEELAKNAEAA